jgi:hypothetical protein
MLLNVQIPVCGVDGFLINLQAFLCKTASTSNCLKSVTYRLAAELGQSPVRA